MVQRIFYPSSGELGGPDIILVDILGLIFRELFDCPSCDVSDGSKLGYCMEYQFYYRFLFEICANRDLFIGVHDLTIRRRFWLG